MPHLSLCIRLGRLSWAGTGEIWATGLCEGDAMLLGAALHIRPLIGMELRQALKGLLNRAV
jgi:hypothetical protein